MNPLLGQEIAALRVRYDEEPTHSDQVALLALQLFGGLAIAFNLTGRQRELLHGAALLHDIGWSQTPDGKGHHKESARLIREALWQALTPEEIELVALIARYHRKAIPQPEHEDFQALSAQSQNSVMILGGILRLADALDRTHTRKIEHAVMMDHQAALIVEVKPTGPWKAEREMFAAKSDMLRTALGREILCVAMDEVV